MAAKDLIKGLGNSITNGITGGIGSSISGAISGLLGGVLGLGGSAEKRQWKLEQKRMEEQFRYNKAMADYNHMLGLQMYEATGYKSQVRQMREAGLNPALMYGSAGTTGQATQGTGAGVQQGNTQAVMMGLNMVRMQKDIELADAQISKTREEAKTEESKRGVNESVQKLNDTISKLNTAKLDEIPETINLIKEQVIAMKSNNVVLTATEQERIAIVWENALKAQWEQIEARLSAEIKEKERDMLATKQERWQEYIDAEIRKLQAEGIEKEVNAKLAETKISEILQMIGETGLNERKFGLDTIMGYVNAGIRGASTLAQILPVGKVLKLISLGLSKIGRKK